MAASAVLKSVELRCNIGVDNAALIKHGGMFSCVATKYFIAGGNSGG